MRIGVVRMLPGLGDLLCAVPALRALRRAQPEAQVTFIGLPRGRWMHERFPSYIDHWSPCHTCPGLPESEPDPVAHEDFLRAARAARFDLAVQMHGDGRASNPFTASLGARRWGGLRPPGSRPSDALLHELDEIRHQIERCGDALRAAGIGIVDDDTPSSSCRSTSTTGPSSRRCWAPSLAGAPRSGWAAPPSSSSRIAPGPRRPSEVATMLFTSVLIPPLAVAYWLAGRIAHPAARTRPSNERPDGDVSAGRRPGTKT